jgi:cell wall-associated NlpC family hydrolase
MTACGLAALLAAGCAARSATAVPQPFPKPAVKTVDSAGVSNLPLSAAVAALVDTALRLQGAPYRNGGSDPTGFDCSGFTQYVFGQYHVALPREVRTQWDAGVLVPADRIARGDLVFFSTTEPGPSHVGIALDEDQFVHAPSSNGVVRVERRHANYWASRFVGARRVTLP